MRLPTRYGLTGIGALAILSLVHWLRGISPAGSPVREYGLGLAPNFAAAIAIAFVLLSIWTDQNKDATFTATRRAFLVTASISGFGLVGWEFVQKTSTRFVFDPYDVGATVLGLAVAALLFHLLTPRGDDSPEGRHGS